MPSTLASRQADNTGSSFGGGGDTKFAGGAPAGVSDSTSSPVPSTVGNTVGQPTPFNLGEWETSSVSSAQFSRREIFQLPPSPRLNIPLCHPATPISTEELAGCLACSTAEVWRGAESTLPPPRVFRCPQLPGRPAPRSSRTRPTDLGEIREGQSPSLSRDLILYF